MALSGVENYMPLEREFEPSTAAWAREQVELYEAPG